MNDKMLSVIVTIYNTDRHLEQCIQSIVGQTFKNIEIILIDDGSTDKSGYICDKYAKKDSRICVVHKANEGVINARLDGLRYAHSEYVTFVDGDDWLSFNMYETLMKKMMEYQVDLVTSGCFRYYSEDYKVKSFDEKIREGIYNVEKIQNDIIPVMLWEHNKDGWILDPSLCMKIFKKNILMRQYERVENRRFLYGEDTVVFYPYMLEIKSMYCTHELLYFHRQRSKETVAEYLVNDSFFDNLLEVYHILHDVFESANSRSCLIKQLDYFYMKSVLHYSRKYGKEYRRTNKLYLFPFHIIPKGSDIIIYGAGNVGIQYFMQVKKTGFCNIISWVDKQFKSIGESIIESPDTILEKEYDYILIAILNEYVKNEVKERLIKIGVDVKTIIDNISIIETS